MRSGRRQRQRHHVLELVAEAEGAAGLVVRRSGPRAGSSGPGRAASGSSAGRRSRPACAPATASRTSSQDSRDRVARRLAPPPPRRAGRRARGPRPRPGPGRAGTRGGASRPARASTRDVQRRAGIEPGAEAAGERRRGERRRAPRASRCGRGTTCGRRSPSAAARSRARRPRGPRSPGCRRCGPAPRRVARVELGDDVERAGRRAAARAPTRCRRTRSGAAAGPLSLVSVRSENFTGSCAVHEDLELAGGCRGRRARSA